MINTLRSSDENEVRLAKRLNHLYDSAISDDRVLDMAVVQKEVHSFWRTVRDNRQMTFSSQRKTKATMGVQGSQNEERKENRKRKRRNKENKKKSENISNTIKESKGDTENMIKGKRKGQKVYLTRTAWITVGHGIVTGVDKLGTSVEIAKSRVHYYAQHI